MSLTETQIQRYARHVLLAEVGGAGQTRLLAAAAHVQGDGRAAEEAALYLAAAGVGRLSLSPALADRLGPRLADLNPDVSLAPPAADAHVVAPAPADDRLAGAMAALSALAHLSGAAPGHAWAAPDEARP